MLSSYLTWMKENGKKPTFSIAVQFRKVLSNRHLKFGSLVMAS